MPSRILNEFKEFISRGNVHDVAIGVLIGATFGKIVNSLVNDIIMPPIGLLMNQIRFKDFFLPLDGNHYASLGAAQKAGIPVINYGNFIADSLQFILIAFVIFAVVKVINILKKNAATPFATAPTKTELLLTEIRDEFKKHSPHL
ncbi:MAG: large-conductance mechanosensitive channel protein MscL [Verrucomicrobia bacterium]|nr:MAG: large-conductance mechanosensitive channel protein MscL [Verrucomicrobiota bacterium]